MKSIKLFFTSLTFISVVSQAQEANINSSNLISDTEKIATEYFNPTFKGLIYGMNSGWYHTAKVHKTLGFDITIGANASVIPSKDEIFNLLELNLSNNTVFTGTNTPPTIAGSSGNTEIIHTVEAEGSYLGSSYTYDTSINFQLPDGIKDDLPLNAIPTPSIQIGLGLPKKFEVIVRATPKIGSDDVKGNLFGLGIKKEITSIFGPIDKTPFHLSILAAFSKMKVDYTIDNINEENVDVSNGSIDFDLTSYTVQAIASINFPIINFYGGLGYNGGKSTLDLLGNYTLYYDGTVPASIGLPNNTATVTDNISNPLSIETNVNTFNATIGTRISLGFFKIFGSYTLQEYNTINAGIAFSFDRKI